MSISPISDIVLEVVKAADPAKSRAATEMLAHGIFTQKDSSGFDNAMTAALTMLHATTTSLGGRSPKSSAKVDSPHAQSKAYKGMEQLVLKHLVESMLPKETGAFFGGGTAGDIWRSFLADQLATQLGKTIELGIMPPPHMAANLSTGRVTI